MQVLSHTYELNDFLNNPEYIKKLKNKYDSVLLFEWDQLRQLLWKENTVVSPVKFIKTIQKLARIKKMDLFTGFAQNDLPEFFLFVIDCFHNAIAREVTMTVHGSPENETDKIAMQCFSTIKKMYTKEYSEIWNLFFGIHISEIVSLDVSNDTSKVLSRNPEPFLMINLSIPMNNKSPTMKDCFDLYVQGEILKDENAWYNEETKKKENVQKRISFWSLPEILVMDLKRNNTTNIYNKNQILVDFPLTNMDLSGYVIGYKKESYIYDLYGICNHSGTTFGGHYTAFVKNANGKWYHFNDTSVTEVNDPQQMITPKAYCFFYRKKTVP
jgi:ubiquitin C-terminal hydrolase